MLKKIFIILIMSFLLVGMCGNVFAKDTYTATSTINGVTVNWEYELNNSNQIENLICKNVAELVGNITIPSTLDGKTVITLGNDAFKSAKGITEITIPNSVQKIEHSAFENCTKLNKVDLGSITSLSFDVFKGCTSLKEITIPKTLKSGSVSPCLNNPSITKITLEEGLTIVPKNLCANTGITEITIPNSVKEIEYSAFDNCTNLKKITILDNVDKIGFYNINSTESIFKNHDENLTIYCYKDSMAAKYAIKYNIKYVYLTKPAIDNNENKEENKNHVENTKNEIQNTTNTTQKPTTNTDKKDNTIATGKLPQAGISQIIIINLIMIAVISLVLYTKYNSYKDVK